MNAALAALGIDVRVVRSVPHVGAHGEPVVVLRLVARALRGAVAGQAAGVVVFERMVDEREGELRRGAA